MKKKILLVISMTALLACLFAISVSAETVLKSQDTNAYGELSLFDESVTVGRTVVGHGFSPYIDAEGTAYARIVIGDGTTFYTFPTAYALGNVAWGGNGKCLFVLDLASLNTAVANATGTNPNWTCKSIYRIEMPYNMLYLNGGSGQSFGDWANVVEIYLQPNTTTKDTGRTLLFWKCANLETIHNLDTFIFKKNCTNGAFQGCAKLTEIKFATSPDVTTTLESMFSGCTSLESFDIATSFPNLTTIGKWTFYGCTSLESIEIPSGITLIDDYAFQDCKGLASVKFTGDPGENVIIDQAAFENCKALTSIVIPEGVTTLGNCAFKGCSSLSSVTLPTTLSTLTGSEQFLNTALTEVNGLENTQITTITYAMFKGLSKWTPDVIKLPNTVTSIAQYGLADVGMKSVVLGAGMKTIGTEAFVNCKNLQSVYIPSGVTSIVSSAFSNKLRDDILFFVTSEDEAYLATVQAGVKFDDATDIVSYEAYLSSKDSYSTGRHVIYGLDYCKTFYGDHNTTGVIGVNQFKDAPYVSSYVCLRECLQCGKTLESEICAPLVTSKGYSKELNGSFFTYGIVFNKEEITKFLAVQEDGYEFNYGIVLANAELSANGILFGENAQVVDGAYVLDVTNTKYTIYDLKITGIKDTQKDTSVYASAYVIDNGASSYIGEGVSSKAVAITYNSIKNQTSGDEE